MAALFCACCLNTALVRSATLPPPNTVLLSGNLKQANAPSEGEHDFQFQIFNAETGGQIPSGAKTVTLTQPVVDGSWQIAIDIRQFGAEVEILGAPGGTEEITPPQSYVGILDNTFRPPQGWVSLPDDTVRPSMGSRSLRDNTFHTATALNWRAVQGTWLEISVRKKGNGPFVPLVPRQRLTAVPGAIVAQTANHALVAGTVSEGGVDARALAPGAVTADKLSVGAITTAALGDFSITAPKLANATVVRSINGIQDDVTIAAGTGVTLSKTGTILTITATGSSGGGGSGGTLLPNGNFRGADNQNTFPSSTNSVIAGGRENEIRSSTDATVAGGDRNVAQGNYAAIGGGFANNAGYAGTVGGGYINQAKGPYSVVGGGYFNSVDHNSANPFSGDLTGFEFIGAGQNNTLTNSRSSAITGGEGNRIENASGSVIVGGLSGSIGRDSSLSFIGGGSGNRIETNSIWSVLIGGNGNRIGANSSDSFIGGGQANHVGDGSNWSSITAGYNNLVADSVANTVIGGGYSNIARNGNSSTIAGGNQNIVDGSFSTVGGGGSNFAGSNATVAGGGGNRASGNFATIAGGVGNAALSDQAVVAGGNNNVVDTSLDGTVGGGGNNHMTNSAHGTIGGGNDNYIFNGFGTVIAGGLANVAASQASAILGGEGNRTDGAQGYATVLGGSLNVASGMHSLAAGHRAEARHHGSWVWNGWPGRNDSMPFVTERDGEFAVRAPGGVRVVTEGTEPGYGDIRLDAGSASLVASGRNANLTFNQAFNVTAGDGVNLVTGGKGLFVDGQKVGASAGGGNGSLTVITGGGQTDPQARLEQTNPDDYVRLMMNTPRSFWTIGTGPDGAFGFYVPGQSPANTTGDNGAHRFLITANGEVGVGSERPLAQFHVRGHGGFDLPQVRVTQQNAQDFARLRLETGPQSWDIAVGPDGSLRFFGGGADRLVLGADGIQLTTGGAGLTVNGRTVAYVDQLGQGGGQSGNGGAFSATVTQGTAITATSQDAQAGVAVSATGRVGIRTTSSSAQGAAVQAIQLNGSGYAGDFTGKVKVSSTLEANGGVKLTGAVRVSGMGTNTPTAAFRLVPDLLAHVSLANPGGITTQLAVLDHPSLNGNPAAVVLLTPLNASALKLYQRTSDVLRGDFLFYSEDLPTTPSELRGRWALDTTRTPPPFGQPDTGSIAVFNALIVTP